MLVAEKNRLADILERLCKREPQPPVTADVVPAPRDLRAHTALRGTAVEMIGIPGPNWTIRRKQGR